MCRRFAPCAYAFQVYGLGICWVKGQVGKGRSEKECMLPRTARDFEHVTLCWKQVR